jgi:SCY1-like protein 2
VEREHIQHLQAVRRADEQTTAFSGNGAIGFDGTAVTGEVDFEALVGSKNGNNQGTSIHNGKAQDARGVSGLSLDDPWDRTDDWLDSAPSAQAIATSSNRVNSSHRTASANTLTNNANKLKARPIPASSFDSSAFVNPLTASPSVNNNNQAHNNLFKSSPALPPPQAPMQLSYPVQSSGPNYNITLNPQTPTNSGFTAGMTANTAFTPMLAPTATASLGPPGWSNNGSMSIGGILQPTKQATAGTTKKSFNDADWGDFDPLK